MFPEVPKCPKAVSRADLVPELEILIDTKAYNEVKVIRKCCSARGRDLVDAKPSIGRNRPFFSMRYGPFFGKLFGIYILPEWYRVNH